MCLFGTSLTIVCWNLNFNFIYSTALLKIWKILTLFRIWFIFEITLECSLIGIHQEALREHFSAISSFTQSNLRTGVYCFNRTNCHRCPSSIICSQLLVACLQNYYIMTRISQGYSRKVMLNTTNVTVSAQTSII